MGKAKHKRLPENSGIAIGPILFIIALLGLLAAAISAGAGFFSTSTGGESNKAQASAVIEQARLLQEAVEIVKGNGCEDTQISFENGVVSGYTNPNAPADHSCHVFDPNGGRIIFPTISETTLDTSGRQYFIFPARYCVSGLGNCQSQTAALLALLPVESLSLCNEINNKLGVSGALQQYPFLNTGAVKFSGLYYAGTEIATGHSMICIDNTAHMGHILFSSYYVFVDVLLVR